MCWYRSFLFLGLVYFSRGTLPKKKQGTTGGPRFVGELHPGLGGGGLGGGGKVDWGGWKGWGLEGLGVGRVGGWKGWGLEGLGIGRVGGSWGAHILRFH